MKTSTAHSHRAVNVKHGGVLVPGVGVPHQLWANFAPLLWKYHSYRMWAEIITDFLIITFPLHMDGKWSVLFKHPKHWGPPGTSLEPQNQWSFDIITNHYWKQLSWWRWWCLVTNQHIYVCVTWSWTFLPRYKPEEKLRISSKVGVDPQEPAVALYIPQNTHHCATRWWFFFLAGKHCWPLDLSTTASKSLSVSVSNKSVSTCFYIEQGQIGWFNIYQCW